jgi:glycosyltransferase involved in cell wall biosynthesis
MRRTLESVAAQSVRPALWVIVDDGSKDETPKILAEFASARPWVRVVTRPDRGDRKVGPGVIEAFYAGLDGVNLDEYDYLCKLDLDLELPARYFELLMQRMEADERLGTCSGKPYGRHPRTGILSREMCSDEMSVGMTKFYRVACFQEIGGFVREVMWDGIDCHRCRMQGWKACSFDDPELRFVHLRPMGSSQQGIWTGRMRHGYGQYFMGTGLVYMTVSAIYRMFLPPVLVGSVAMWWGYVKSMILRLPRYGDVKFRARLRRFQWDCLVKGKRAAVRRAAEAVRA